MLTYLWNLDQGSEEWHEKRRNLITATDAYDLLNGISKADILARKSQSTTFTSPATQRGHDLEPQARELYSQSTGKEIRTCGMILNSKYPDCGISPDGVITDEFALIEIKSFEYAHHQALHNNSDPHVMAQIQFQLLISEVDYVDLVQYCPDAPDFDKTYYQTRIFPDPDIRAKLKTALLANPTPSQELNTDVSEIMSLQQNIQALESDFGEIFAQYQEYKQALENLKQRLKENTSGKISKKVTVGDNELSLSIHDSHRVKVSNLEEIPDEYMQEEEIQNAYYKDGKVYQKFPNTKLVSNLLKTGKPLPSGFTDTPIRSISIKFNGKAI